MKNLTSSVFLILACTSVTNAFAEDSPLSPALVLKPDQVLSITNAEYYDVDLKVSRNIAGFGNFRATGNVDARMFIQTFRLGLPSNYEVNISESFSSLKTNDNQIASTTDGFSNPTIGGKKIWGADTPVRLSAFGSITPKTGDHALRDIRTRYDLGAGGVFITPNGLTTSLGVSRRITTGDDSLNSTLFSIGAYKEIGEYALNVVGSIRSFDNKGSSSITIKEESAQTISASIGKKINNNAWLELIYRYVDSDYQSVHLAPGDTIEAESNETQIGASLKLLF